MIRRFFFQFLDPRDTTGAAAPDPANAGSATASDDSGDDAPPQATDIADAGAAFLAALPDDAKNRPWETAPDGDVDDDLDDTDEGEPAARGDDTDEQDEDEGKQQRDDQGKFLPKPGAESGAPAAADPKLTIVLPGLADRNEEPIELDAPDIQTADRLRRLLNDGMRAAEYKVRNQALTEREDAIADTEAEINASPVAWILKNCTPERQVEIAQAILVEHYEKLAPEFDALSDNEERLQRQLKRERESRDGDKALDAARARRRYTTSMLNAVAELIPAGTDPKVEQRFLKDAERDLIDAINAGEQLQPSDVARVLEYRRGQYFPAPAKPAEGGPPRPLSDEAKAIARRAQDERKTKLQLKRAATRTGGAGIGATTTSPPVIPKGATIDEATATLRKRGLPSTWNG
jgi:hypothetical protein